MTKRQAYDVKVWFTYSNGQRGGLLDTPVRSRANVARQIHANLAWLAIKGHRATRVLTKELDA